MAVYVPQEVMYRNQNNELVPKFNIDVAREHGEIKIVLPYGNVVLAPQPMIRKIKLALTEFSDDDFILPTGDPIAIGVVMSVASELNGGKLKILRWDRKTHGYNIVKMNLRGSHYE